MKEIDNGANKTKRNMYIAGAAVVVIFALFIGIKMHIDYAKEVQTRLLPGLEYMAPGQRQEFRDLEREVNGIITSKMTQEEIATFVKVTSGGTVASPEQARQAAAIMQNVMQRLSDEEKEKVQKFQDMVDSLRQR